MDSGPATEKNENLTQKIKSKNEKKKKKPENSCRMIGALDTKLDSLSD